MSAAETEQLNINARFIFHVVTSGIQLTFPSLTMTTTICVSESAS